MANKKTWLGMLVMVLVFGMMVAGCALFSKSTKNVVPASFVRGNSGETTILLRRGLVYEEAFREAAFILNRHGFESEMMQQDGGYIRTRWNTTWIDQGSSREPYYRVRVILTFNPARTQLFINAEAEYLEGDYWVKGSDSRAIETLRTDLNSIVGN
jgi:hypothetical protein